MEFRKEEAYAVGAFHQKLMANLKLPLTWTGRHHSYMQGTNLHERLRMSLHALSLC